MRDQWIKEAIEKCPDDSYGYLERCYEDFWNLQPQTGSWWDELFVESIGECVDAIIDHPVPDGFVKDRVAWSCS